MSATSCLLAPSATCPHQKHMDLLMSMLFLFFSLLMKAMRLRAGSFAKGGIGWVRSLIYWQRNFESSKKLLGCTMSCMWTNPRNLLTTANRNFLSIHRSINVCNDILGVATALRRKREITIGSQQK